MKNHPPTGATTKARALPRNATDAERALWTILRENFPDSRFRRQVPIRHYIADFASHRDRIVVEADGGQHSPEADAERTKVIEAEGYRLLRFWNNDILTNGDGVASAISGALAPASPPPNPPPSRGRALESETDFIAAIRALAVDPGARDFLDDAAVLSIGGTTLVLTHDMIVEGVHFLPDDPPGDIAWKLVAVNLSDLAAKGARPVGALLGYTLADPTWNAAFIEGLRSALSAFGLLLLGGDTVSVPAGAPRSFGLTAIGEASGPVPSRSGAQAGDDLWVSGAIGDAGAGLHIACGEIQGPATLVERYRQPRPRLELGQALAPLVSAMMDVSDGLLIDASRIAEASNLAIAIAIDTVPLSADLIALSGNDLPARIAAATAGDDYELLFTASPDRRAEIHALSDILAIPLTRIGSASNDSGLALTHHGASVPLPAHLGYRHGAA